MEITAALVKELRERTGAAMMDCKKALVAASGDIETAIEEMRKSGQAKADKKSGRVAADGAIVIQSSDDGKRALMIEINSETDFVARDDNFLAFANQVAGTALDAANEDVAQINELTLRDSSDTVESARQQLITKIGENIQLRRAKLVDTDGVIGSYVHGGRIGVVVDLQGGDIDLAKDIAMHIAASNPLVVTKDDVPEDVIQREREIYTAQAEQSGKPAEIIAKMIEGRLSKYLDEISLLGQPFVKDPNTKVGQLLKSASAEVKGFYRFVVGEGIEKKVDNFVEEVMAQVSES